jgi:hypothetical protein
MRICQGQTCSLDMKQALSCFFTSDLLDACDACHYSAVKVRADKKSPALSACVGGHWVSRSASNWACALISVSCALTSSPPLALLRANFLADFSSRLTP